MSPPLPLLLALPLKEQPALPRRVQQRLVEHERGGRSLCPAAHDLPGEAAAGHASARCSLLGDEDDERLVLLGELVPVAQGYTLVEMYLRYLRISSIYEVSDDQIQFCTAHMFRRRSCEAEQLDADPFEQSHIHHTSKSSTILAVGGPRDAVGEGAIDKIPFVFRLSAQLRGLLEGYCMGLTCFLFSIG